MSFIKHPDYWTPENYVVAYMIFSSICTVIFLTLIYVSYVSITDNINLSKCKETCSPYPVEVCSELASKCTTKNGPIIIEN